MQIILCADDFALNPDISQGIINLAERRRISATSCMTTSPHWQHYAKLLKPFTDSIDIGLHFNLTCGNALTKTHFHRINKLLKRSLLRQLDKVEICHELHAQLDEFEAALDRPVDFIDGHQHIQQFAQIRDCLVDVMVQRNLSKNAYVRVSKQPCSFGNSSIIEILKKSVIQHANSSALIRSLEKNNIQYNRSFSGIYNLMREQDYAQYFQKFLNEIKTNGIIMCHPGLPGIGEADDHPHSRVIEYDFFSSEDFPALLKKNNVILSRFNP